AETDLETGLARTWAWMNAAAPPAGTTPTSERNR
ncbi:MAG: hypothetical protein FD129_2624, partial [bacterium]